YASALWNTGDHLDLEIEAGKPVDADGCPVGVGRSGEHPVLDGHNGFELVFGIGMECGHVDQVVEAATGGVQDVPEIFERAFDLCGKVRLGRTIVTAADLTGNEQEVA